MPVAEGKQARVPERQEPEGEREVCQVLLQGEGPQDYHRREGREDADVLHGVYLPTGKVHLTTPPTKTGKKTAAVRQTLEL